MIDIHCHLLPGIDDGPATTEDALALARALVDDGVQHAVCTPHVFPGRFDNQRSSIAADFARFEAALAREGIDLPVMWAGEVRLTPEVLDLLARDELPFLGQVQDCRTLLLELPDGQIPIGAGRFVARLTAQAIRPVIVHPERNRAVMEDPERLRPFVQDGCFVQVTAASITGHFGECAQRATQYMLDRGWVHAVASDSHNLAGRRPRMREAAQWLGEHYGELVMRALTVLGPAGLCRHNEAANQATRGRSHAQDSRGAP
jgi:protein-tyrosine phosphatase